QAFHALEQAATPRPGARPGARPRPSRPPPGPATRPSWAREVLSPSPLPSHPFTPRPPPARHLLDLSTALHQKSRRRISTPSPRRWTSTHPSHKVPLQHLLDWHRNAARHGLRFLYRFEGELDGAEQALDAWNLQDAHRQLQQLQQLLTQPPWPLPTHLLERLDKLRTRFQHQHHLGAPCGSRWTTATIWR
ncbi:MAG: hypothetical protein Q9O62_10325, partial [Ardenticatenia bacterium]|nr:hypothetical protein [Ardenticatenia bacterium]